MKGAAIIIVLCLTAPVLAHEVRPAYLEMHEDSAGKFRVLWKTPMRGDLRLALSPAFSGPTELLTPITTRRTDNAAVQTWTLKAVRPLRGQSLRIAGLEATMTDALVRIEFADGGAWVKRLTPAEPAAEIPARQSLWQLAAVYSRLGFEHILLGVDHLLFVLGLLLIVRGRLTLFKTITAFTVAHSLTLAVATLGFASAPLAPLNAAIAMSILFLGPEIVRTWRGETSLTIRRPWVGALAFGLLHGFGFASGLSTTGMARAAIPQALLWFNVGVELGQVAFVGLFLALGWSYRVLEMRWPVWVARAPGYSVGVCGAFWFIERTALILQGPAS
jgi:hydrogenase/urease accessory protein HupE